MKLLTALLFATSFARAATPPPDVMDFFRTLVENLADSDEQGVLDHFDSTMKGYAELRDDVKTLLEARDVTATIEFVTDEGDADRRALQIDWVLTTTAKVDVGQSSTQRVVAKCRIERKADAQSNPRRKTKIEWKITAFDPVGLFKLS